MLCNKYMCTFLALKNQVKFAIEMRHYSSREIKRFYKNVSISKAEGGYEINLDKHKLRTPMGKLFKVPSEALATAVANEWAVQNKTIKRHNMHLTSLSNTAIDNPTGRSKQTVINSTLELLDTDTIFYRVEDPPELFHLQRAEWDPIMQFISNRYGVELSVTTGLGVPAIPNQTKETFIQHLRSYNDWALVGYQHAADCIKSFVIATALVDRHIGVERAVRLARLELEYQIGIWGNVEWHHDADEVELRTRLAASLLFVHLNCTDSKIVFNKSDRFLPVQA